MPITNKPYTFSAGAVIIASEHNSNFDALFNLVNGTLDTTNLAANAAIVDTQLAQITTASKVAGSAINITGLTTVTAVGADYAYISDSSDSGNPKKALVSDFSLYTPTPANALAGSVIQVVNTSFSAVATGTTALPFDDSIPQSGEGTEFMTRAITPNSATNKLKITVVAQLASSAGSQLSMALFQDATAGALKAIPQEIGNANQPYILTFIHYMDAGTTSATTFKIRAGNDSGAGTVTFNGVSAARIFGGVMGSSMTIEEIKV